MAGKDISIILISFLGGMTLFTNTRDNSDSIIDRVTGNEKIDPGIFSLMEPGWWALHATAIAGIYLLGSKLHNRY